MKQLAIIFTIFYFMFNILNAQELVVKELNPIPDATGFAGSFAGIINGNLVVAGGSNFPNGGAPWKGDAKVWYDKVFLLNNENCNWQQIGKLPHAAGYGVSISVPQGLICIGGSSKEEHSNDVFLLTIKGNRLSVDTLASLPVPLANMCGALAENVIYIAGGITRPDADTTEALFFSIDISKGLHEAKWQQLPAWPGPTRMLSACVTVKNSFYLLSGAELKSSARNYLKDAYRYSPLTGWEQIADLPVATVAAPGPLLHTDEYLYLIGGDDGSNATKNLQLQHPGFLSTVYRYDLANDNWEKIADLKKSKKELLIPVTTTSVFWKGKWIIPGGEIKPGVRTSKVFAISLKK